MRSLFLLLGFVVAVAFLVRDDSAGAQPAASRIVDRTLACEIGSLGGVHQVEIKASSALKQGELKHSGYADVTTNVSPTWRLANVSGSGLELSPSCKPTRTRVPLTSRGLSGGVTRQFEETYDCTTPQTVLIRLWAKFRSPTTLRRGRPYGFPSLFARGDILEGKLAISTRAGKPLVSATLETSGKVRLFTSGNCFPD